MKKSMKAILSASVAALCVFGVGFSASAYELNAEVKDVTPALREASTSVYGTIQTRISRI